MLLLELSSSGSQRCFALFLSLTVVFFFLLFFLHAIKAKPMQSISFTKLMCSDCTPLCCCRDSGQPDVFFTLSYQSDDGPTSVRIQLNKLHFNLFGSQRTFPSLFALLTYYTSSCCKLTVPFRIHRPEGLKQMCRRAFVGVFGADRISTLPGLNKQVRSYLWAYPHPI